MQSKPQSTRKLFRVPAARDYLGGVITESTLRQWIWRRQIESVRVGRAVCIPQSALDELIERNTTPALEQ
jgi:excisionase family DNA binding protein